MPYSHPTDDADDILIVAVLAALAADTDLAALTICDHGDPDLLQKIQAALTGTGVYALVMDSDLADSEPLIVATVSIMVREHVRQNRGAVGTQVTGHAWSKRIAATLRNLTAPDPWTELRRFAVHQVDSDTDTIAWLVTCETRTGTLNVAAPPTPEPES